MAGRWLKIPAYHLDTSACNTMLIALSSLNAKRELSPQAGEDYGFAEPALTIEVTAAGETDTYTFGTEQYHDRGSLCPQE